jgi:Protein of unknown function (DUF1573)
MKRINYLFFVVAFSFLSACESSERKLTSDLLNFPNAETGEVQEDLPKIVFDQELVEMGKVVVGEKFNYTFHFRNEGKGLLQIAHVTPSCGCTTLKDWPKNPMKPGEEGNITVELNTTNLSGPVEKSIQVSTNGIPRDVFLKVVGEVVGQAANPNYEQNGPEMERIK